MAYNSSSHLPTYQMNDDNWSSSLSRLIILLIASLLQRRRNHPGLAEPLPVCPHRCVQRQMRPSRDGKNRRVVQGLSDGQRRRQAVVPESITRAETDEHSGRVSREAKQPISVHLYPPVRRRVSFSSSVLIAYFFPTSLCLVKHFGCTNTFEDLKNSHHLFDDFYYTIIALGIPIKTTEQ